MPMGEPGARADLSTVTAQIQQLPDPLPSSSSPCEGLAVQALPCRVLTAPLLGSSKQGEAKLSSPWGPAGPQQVSCFPRTQLTLSPSRIVPPTCLAGRRMRAPGVSREF